MAKRRRRANGEGSRPVRLPNGRYKVTRTVNWRTRKTESRTFDTAAQCADWLAEKRIIKDAAESTDQTTLLFADWIASWLEDVKRSQATTTYQSYLYHIENFVTPNLGSVPILDLKPLAFRNLFNDLEDLRVGKGTLQKLYAALHSCMETATKMEVIPRNPISNVSRPKHTRKDIEPFTLDEVKRILGAVHGDRLRGLYTLAFHLGLRQGELYALEWDDLDTMAKTLSIRRQIVFTKGGKEIKEPKTKAGNRMLDIAGETLEVLLDRRRIAMGEGLAGCPIIFPTKSGTHLQRSTFAAREWKKLLKRLGIAHRGMHHCRHTFASLALANGEPLIDISAILGHADPSVTLRIYSHAVEAGQRKTAERVAKLFAG